MLRRKSRRESSRATGPLTGTAASSPAGMPRVSSHHAGGSREGQPSWPCSCSPRRRRSARRSSPTTGRTRSTARSRTSARAPPSRDPHADPFCVRFDKTGQNVTELGVVDFLAQEPARVAAAVDKCFYYQSRPLDRLDRAGATAASSTTSRAATSSTRRAGAAECISTTCASLGQSVDPAVIPGIPGRVPAVLRQRQRRRAIQRVRGRPRPALRRARQAQAGVPGRRETAAAAGSAAGVIGRGIGGIGLGARRSRVRAALGKPTSESTRSLTYCLEDGSLLRAGFTGDRVSVVRTTHPAFTTAGLGPGLAEGRARRILRGERVMRSRSGERLLVLSQKRRTLVAATRGRVVRSVAVARPRLSKRKLGAQLRLVR